MMNIGKMRKFMNRNKKVNKTLDEQIEEQKRRLEILEAKADKQKKDTILYFFKPLIEDIDIFNLLYLNKENKDLQNEVVNYVKVRLIENKNGGNSE